MNPEFCYVLLAAAMLCTSFTTTESKQVIFYNDQGTVKQSNLLISVQRTKPCGMGMKRDHNNRCRRVVTFTRKRRS